MPTVLRTFAKTVLLIELPLLTNAAPLWPQE
jgi:hypothetical protein